MSTTFKQVESDLGGLLNAVPKTASPPVVGHGAGLLAHLQDLYTAVKAGDLRGIGLALSEVWECIVGPPVMGGATPEPVVTVAQVQAQAAAVGLDWGKLISILKLILDLFA